MLLHQLNANFDANLRMISNDFSDGVKMGTRIGKPIGIAIGAMRASQIYYGGAKYDNLGIGAGGQFCFSYAFWTVACAAVGGTVNVVAKAAARTFPVL